MPQKTSPQSLGTVLTLLREIQGWPQNELAAALGCSPTLVCDYEAGRKALSRKRLDAIAAVLGLPPEAVDRTLAYLAHIRALSPPEGGTAGLEESARAFIAQMTANAEAYARSMLMLDDQRRAQEARHDARFLWERLKPLTPAQRRAKVDASQEFRTWALCELICEKSLEAAADRADRALELASLAVHVAERAPGQEDWRMRLQGYALAHLANARRVGGDLIAADKVFVRARKLWEVGAAAETPLLQAALMPGLEASLRRDQRRFSEALALLDQSLTLASGPLHSQLLVNQANVLSQLGDFERSIAVLHDAERLSRLSKETRLIWLIKFSLANNLVRLGRSSEAKNLLPELRELTTQLKNELDRIRLCWLESRVAVELGEKHKAIAILVEVCEEFVSRRIAYDAALAVMELACLYLDAGHPAKVRTLTRQIFWVFQAQVVHREALAAIQLFCDAVEEEIITSEAVREILHYLRQAQGDPGLRFEPQQPMPRLPKKRALSKERA